MKKGILLCLLIVAGSAAAKEGVILSGDISSVKCFGDDQVVVFTHSGCAVSGQMLITGAPGETHIAVQGRICPASVELPAPRKNNVMTIERETDCEKK